MKKIAELWESIGAIEEKKVRCNVCSHYCIIPPGKRGFCQSRENIDGTLYVLNYGSCISKGSIDPVEKKPLYHFYPGSNVFSIATVGCSFRCKHCQNWNIGPAAYPNEDGTIANIFKKDESYAQPFLLTQLTPSEVVTRAKKANCKSIAYTYNEPTIWFEFIKDTALIAKEEGIKNILVTNGYSSMESNEEYINFIDAANIDIKGFNDSFYKKIVGVPSLQPVLDTAEFMKKNGVHIEITNLIIPNENDNLDDIRSMVKWIINHLGKDTPLHFSAYHPSYRLNNPRTPIKILNNAWKLAKDEGLNYVFMGNVLADEGGNTYCPQCKKILLERKGYHIINRNLTKENECGYCGLKIPIKGFFSQERRSYFF
ncbi:MAG: AmmeMemoRadiSam system radical SAM enzyme [Promethearchaeota archaeon]